MSPRPIEHQHCLRQRFAAAFGPRYILTPGGRRLFRLALDKLRDGELVLLTVVDGHPFVGNYLPQALPPGLLHRQ